MLSVYIHKHFSFIEIIKTADDIINSKVNHSIFILCLLNFEYLVKIEGILKV